MIRTSESINELAAALSAAQGEMAGAKKDAANPFFKSKYADLSSVIEAINVPFKLNSLSFIQGTGRDPDGRVLVTTRIMHSSGQWVECDTILTAVKDDPQGIGSAISYAKRYGLQALAGVPSVDDDGNAAVAHVKLPIKNEPRPIALAKARNRLESAAQEGLTRLKEEWTSLTKETHAALGEEYLRGLQKKARDADFYADNEPENPNEPA